MMSCTIESVNKGNGEWKAVSISGTLWLNSQSLLLTIDPRQSMRSGFLVARDSCDVTHSLKQAAYTPVMSMLQKAVQSTHYKSHCTSCNQPAHTNVIMLYAVKCSLYVVGPFLCRTLHKSWSTGGENVTKLLGVPKRTW